MKWWSYIICALLIFLGFAAGVWLYDRFGIENASYGTPITIEQQQGLEEVVRYDFGYITLSDDDEDDTYTFQQTFAPVDYNGNLNDYTLYFNSQPVQNIRVSAGAISGEISFKFYDIDNELITEATLEISIAFYENTTQMLLEIDNVNDSVSYFSTYMNYNGAILKLLTVGGETNE